MKYFLSDLNFFGQNYSSSKKNVYKVLSVSRPAAMQIYWTKESVLYKKRIKLPQNWFGTPT